MASTEEGLLTLLLSVEHLKNTAIEQQKAVADTLAVARETLRGYRDISDSVVKQVSDEVRKGVQKTDIAGLMGERMTQDFQRLEETVAKMRANAEALNKDIATIHHNVVKEYNTLNKYSLKWFIGVTVSFLVMFSLLGWFTKTLIDRNYTATEVVYQKIVDIEKKLDKPATGKSRKKLTRFACPTPHGTRKNSASREAFSDEKVCCFAPFALLNARNRSRIAFVNSYAGS